jgi:hypothetical protein
MRYKSKTPAKSNNMKPDLMSASFTFGQEGNTEGTTSEYEEIVIEYQNPFDLHHGFFVLRTTGWSIDNAAELAELLDRIIRVDIKEK